MRTERSCMQRELYRYRWILTGLFPGTFHHILQRSVVPRETARL